jgi:hypothetical protein
MRRTGTLTWPVLDILPHKILCAALSMLHFSSMTTGDFPPSYTAESV